MNIFCSIWNIFCLLCSKSFLQTFFVPFGVFFTHVFPHQRQSFFKDLWALLAVKNNDGCRLLELFYLKIGLGIDSWLCEHLYVYWMAMLWSLLERTFLWWKKRKLCFRFSYDLDRCQKLLPQKCNVFNTRMYFHYTGMTNRCTFFHAIVLAQKWTKQSLWK